MKISIFTFPVLWYCISEYAASIDMVTGSFWNVNSVEDSGNGLGLTEVQGDTKKTGTFEKPNKNWRNPTKKIYWQKLNHYNLPFKRQ